MGSKSSSVPEAPDYTPIAQSSLEAAKVQSKTSADQLQWSKEQYYQQAPITNAYLEQMTADSKQQSENAQTDRSRYESIYQPTENNFVKQANNWNSPQRANQEAAGAMADVATQFEAQRQAALSGLESYGIDPSQTRYGALDLGTRVSQAAATAAAGTQSRRNTEATGLALQGEAINIGKGYPGQVSQSYAGAQNSGNSGITAGLNTSSTYGNLMGTATQWGGLATASNAGATGALNAGYNNALSGQQAQYKQSSDQASGIGSLIGGVAMGAMLLSDRRLKTDIKKVGALESGAAVYTYRYKNHEGPRMMGVMAQELRKTQPDAVAKLPSGYLAVDYAKVK